MASSRFTFGRGIELNLCWVGSSQPLIWFKIGKGGGRWILDCVDSIGWKSSLDWALRGPFNLIGWKPL
jgi:hypothetical protein